jgi:SAM-dependent methyltransferase
MQRDREATYWARHARPFVFYDTAEHDLVLRLLGGPDLAGRRLLELGCGSGTWTSELARLGARVTALDLDAGLVRRAADATAAAANGVVADMQALPFADGSFDAVFGSMVLHHSPDHGRLGREVARVLRPGGRAVFHENSSRNPLLMLARRTVVGRFGIRRTSSPGEHPLRPQEVRRFGRPFARCEARVVRMVLLQLVVRAALRRDHGPLLTLAQRLDGALLRALPAARPWSYYQVVAAEKGPGSPIHHLEL